MFSKVEGEELKIRKDVSARVTTSLQRVFGSLDKKAATLIKNKVNDRENHF